MSSPLPPQPGETPEQRQARLAAAYGVQARIDAEMRAEEAARAKAASTPPTPKAPVKDPFDNPNSAIRAFNDYFRSLRNEYGEDAIRALGFGKADLAKLQGPLTKMLSDPSVTTEQRRQAFNQARDALAQRITTPLAAARSTPSAPPVGTPVEVEVRGVRPPDGVGAPPSMPETVRPVMPEMAVRPPVTPPMPEIEVRRPPPPPIPLHVDPGPRTPVPSATDYIASMVTPPKPAELPMPPVGSPALLGDAPRPVDPSMVPVGSPALLGNAPRPGITPMQPTAPGILPGITQMQPAAPSMNTQPGADFDRNVARQIFDAEFRTLREKYGDEGLRAAGFTPRTLSALQAPLTNVQKDNTISYDQSSAALENALQQLRGYNFGGAQPAAAPAAPMQPAAPLPAGAQQSPIPGYYRGGPAMRYR